MENTNDTTNETKVKKVGRRKPEAAWRYNPDGTYNNKPCSPTYAADYYKSRSYIVICEFCNKSLVMHDLKRHQRTKKCLLLQDFVKEGLMPCFRRKNTIPLDTSDSEPENN